MYMEDIVIFPDDIFFLSAISRNEKDGYIYAWRE